MMRKMFSPALVLLLVAAVGLTGCATEKWVNEQISAFGQVTNTKIHEVQDAVEVNQKEISDLHAKDAELEKEIAMISETAKDALKRAEKAGKLSKGKFLYEVTLTDNDARFGFDKYALSDEAKAALDGFATKAKGITTNAFIEVQGHTDNIGSENYNLNLGYKRAEQVMRYLNMEQGIPLFRMNVISYGEYKPIDDNSTRDGRANNRRVTLVVLE
ncbi:MAG: OmpA family protein [Acidobacteria bacterium]|nr:OmpA family protein [Acidobacteriota bacterium]